MTKRVARNQPQPQLQVQMTVRLEISTGLSQVVNSFMLRMSHLLTVGHFPDVHVLSLLGPLHPHADAILEEGRDEAEAGEVGQDVLPMPGDLHGKTVMIPVRF